MFVKSQVTWDQARAACLSHGGDLAIPTSVSECNSLSQHAQHVGIAIPYIGIFRYSYVYSSVRLSL